MSRLIRRIAVALALAAPALTAPLALSAQQKRPMTIDDLLTAVRIADPVLSPDGTRVLFTRTTTVLASGQRNADLWVVPADGAGPATMLIGGPKSDNTARFLPDGHIAFLSSRDGEMQVYLADADGQNARAVTALSGGVQPPLVVSPDGKMVAFVSDAYPDCANEACNKNAREAAAKDPVKVRTLTRLPFRHWDEWREELRHHVFVADIASGATRDLTPGDFDAPPHNYEDAAIAFSPDSREVAFVSKRDAKDSEMWTTNHDVWTVPAAGGALKKVTSNPAADMQPVYSPDGKSILVRAQRRAGFEADRWYLDAYDRATGLKRTVFETPDLSVDDFSFSPDGRAIWFTAVDKGTTNLYVVPAANGTPKMMARGGAIASVQPGQNFAIFSKSMLTAPAEIFRVGLDGATKALTRENASWLGGVEMPLPESLTVPGAGGAPIQYWVLKPPQFDASKTYPVVFLIHGGPQGDWGDGWSSRWNPALWAAQGWVVVAPNPRGSTGFGQKFVDDISQDWCGKVMTDLDAVFDNVSKQAYADPARMAIAGASYGGYAVDWIIGHSNRFKAAVTHDGVFNLESMALATEELWFSEWDFGGPPWSPAARANYAKCSPHLSVDKIKTPTLVITNEQDFRVPVDQGLQLFTALRRNGVPSQALVFPDEGHWVLKALNSKRWHETVFAWLKKYLAESQPRTALPILIGLSVCHLLNDTLQSLLPAIYPIVKTSFGLGFWQIGLITLTNQATASILQPIVGFVTDRRPQPYSLAAGMCVTLVGLLVLAMSTHFGWLLAAAALVGVGSAIFHPESSRLARVASGGRHGFAQSLFQTGGNLGSSFGPLLVALIVVPYGQRSIAWFSLLAVLALVILVRVGRWYATHRQTTRGAARPPAPHHGLSSTQVGRVIALLLALIFSKYIYLASIASYYTFFLIERFGVSVQSAQLHLFVFLGAVAAGTFIGGPIGDRFGRKYVIWGSILGVLPFTLVLPYASLFWTGVLSVVIGLVIASAFSAILVYAQELLPGRVGLVAGLFFGFAFGVGGLGAAGLGWMADVTGIVWVYRACAFLPLIGLLAVWLPELGPKIDLGGRFPVETTKN